MESSRGEAMGTKRNRRRSALDLVVKTPCGTFLGQYSKDSHVVAVLNDATRKLRLSTLDNPQLVVRGQRLDSQQTLSGYGLRDGWQVEVQLSGR